jgi:hypothetical protein
MPDTAAEQVHFAQYRAQYGKRTHTDAYADRRHEFEIGDAGQQLV